MFRKDELVRRAHEYAQHHALSLGEELGFGVPGIVLSAESQIKTRGSSLHSAVKVHEREPCYLRERDIYLRLKERGIKEIRGCTVPKLIGYDDNLWIIEMSLVAATLRSRFRRRISGLVAGLLRRGHGGLASRQARTIR